MGEVDGFVRGVIDHDGSTFIFHRHFCWLEVVCTFVAVNGVVQLEEFGGQALHRQIKIMEVANSLLQLRTNAKRGMSLLFQRLFVTMSKKGKPCCLCQQNPQHIFALSCDHVLCLSCAWEQVRQERGNYSILCSICQEDTDFELPLFEHLAQQQKNNAVRPNAHQKVGRDAHLMKGTVAEKRGGKYCQEHRDIELTYACQTCSSLLICSQCIIRGPHNTHDVRTIQEKGKNLKNLLEGQLSRLSQTLADLKALESTRAASNLSRRGELEGLRCSILKEYQDIKANIQREEQALLHKCNQLIQLHHQEQTQAQTELLQQIAFLTNKHTIITQLLAPFLQTDSLATDRTTSKLHYINLIHHYSQFQQQNIPSPPPQTLNRIGILKEKMTNEGQLLREKKLGACLAGVGRGETAMIGGGGGRGGGGEYFSLV